MSFDTEFNFANAVTFVDSCIAKENGRLTAFNAEITSLSGLTVPLAVNRVNLLNRLIDQTNTRKTEWESLKTKITDLSNVSADDKLAIYDLWLLAQAMGDNKDRYMAKIVSKPVELANYAKSFVYNNDLTTEQKNTLTSLACQQITPSSEALRLIGRFSLN